MAKICIKHVWPTLYTDAVQTGKREARYFDLFAKRTKNHQIIDDVSKADIVLAFVGYKNVRPHRDPNLLCLRRAEFWRNFRNKCVLYNTEDHPFPFGMCLLTCLRKSWYFHGRMRSAPNFKYLLNTTLDYAHDAKRFRHLYSFRGAFNTHPIRSQLYKIQTNDCPIEDTSEFDRRDKAFAEVYGERLHDSLFVLCPRGFAPNSIRLFETMKVGRVPVVISDEWVPPEGPDWAKCSVRIAEKDFQNIPALLEAKVDDGHKMAKVAREEWLKWFAPDAFFDTLAGYALDLVAHRMNFSMTACCRRAKMFTQQPYRKNFTREFLVKAGILDR